MSNYEELMYQIGHSGQTQYAYFLVALSASAIAFIATQADGRAFSWDMLPLGLALISFCVSFYSGTSYISVSNITLHTNYALLRVLQGRHPTKACPIANPEEASAKLEADLQRLIQRTGILSERLYWGFYFGIALVIIWRLITMTMKSI